MTWLQVSHAYAATRAAADLEGFAHSAAAALRLAPCSQQANGTYAKCHLRKVSPTLSVTMSDLIEILGTFTEMSVGATPNEHLEELCLCILQI